MPFGQIVLGPPGSGKTTYCLRLSETYNSINRETIIINLDPANENLPYKPDIDIRSLISLDAVMEEFGLGPNGAMIYSMEYLETNIDWLFRKLDDFPNSYFLFDCPGQVELATHHRSLHNIIELLVKKLCAVQLVDSHHCTDPSKYISALLLSLQNMFQLALPHINILSKIDLSEKFGKLSFNLDFYTQVQDLSYLLQQLKEDDFGMKFIKLNAAVVELIQDFGLVSFQTLCVDDSESVIHLIRVIDKANGYVFGALELDNSSLFNIIDQGLDY